MTNPLKQTGLILLKLPFVFLPGVLWWVIANSVILFFALLIASWCCNSSGYGGSPFVGLKGICRWISGAYVGAARYLRDCVV